MRFISQLGCVVVLSVSALQAGPLTPSTTFAIGHACIDPANATFVCNSPSAEFGGTTSFSYSNTIVAAGLGSTLSVTAGGIATFGQFGAFSTTSLLDPNFTTKTDTNAAAEMIDIMTITFGNLSGAGYLVVEATVTGTASASGSGKTIFGVAVCPCAAGPSPDRQFILNQTGLVRFQPIAFQYGIPFNLEFGLGTFTDEGPGNGSAAVNFFNTATLSGLRVFDANMVPISNPTFSSGSGTQYTANGVVPEPSSMSLVVAAGIAAFVCKSARAGWLRRMTL